MNSKVRKREYALKINYLLKDIMDLKTKKKK